MIGRWYTPWNTGMMIPIQGCCENRGSGQNKRAWEMNSSPMLFSGDLDAPRIILSLRKAAISHNGNNKSPNNTIDLVCGYHNHHDHHDHSPHSNEFSHIMPSQLTVTIQFNRCKTPPGGSIAQTWQIYNQLASFADPRAQGGPRILFLLRPTTYGVFPLQAVYSPQRPPPPFS